MKNKILSSALAAALICGLLCLPACGGSPAPSAGNPEPEKSQPSASQPAQPEDSSIEDWRAEQKIVVGENTYQYLARALFSEEDDPLTVRLESDVQLTDVSVVLGTSDYGGMFGGQEMTVPSHNITIDLNGYTLAAEKECAVFEVQDGYTLTIVDSSTAKTGRLSADAEPVLVEEGGTYIPLEA